MHVMTSQKIMRTTTKSLLDLDFLCSGAQKRAGKLSGIIEDLEEKYWKCSIGVRVDPGVCIFCRVIKIL